MFSSFFESFWLYQALPFKLYSIIPIKLPNYDVFRASTIAKSKYTTEYKPPSPKRMYYMYSQSIQFKQFQ